MSRRQDMPPSYSPYYTRLASEARTAELRRLALAVWSWAAARAGVPAGRRGPGKTAAC